MAHESDFSSVQYFIFHNLLVTIGAYILNQCYAVHVNLLLFDYLHYGNWKVKITLQNSSWLM